MKEVDAYLYASIFMALTDYSDQETEDEEEEVEAEKEEQEEAF